MCYPLPRSGTEEEYAQLSQLLEDISVYQRDFAVLKEEEKKKESLRKDCDRRKGEQMRQAAVEGRSRRFYFAHLYCYLPLHDHFNPISHKEDVLSND